MPAPLLVENQRFTFGEAWIAFKYDDTKFYRDKVESSLKGMKAVDIVADLTAKKSLLFLEAKDFRGHRIENKQRLIHGELAEEVALKVKDTILALLGAGRSGIDEFDAVALGARLRSKQEFSVVLWVEDDSSVDLLKWKVKLKDISSRIKKHLNWLGPLKVFAISMGTHNPLPDLKVENLPR